MKYFIAVSTFLLVIAFSEVDALECYNCIYNISQGAPVHNPRCGDPFDGDMIATETCDANEMCAKYPAYLGDKSGQFTVSIERRCAVSTGDGCVKFEDAKGGYLKICGNFCGKDECNSAGVFKLNAMAIFLTIIFTVFKLFLL